MTMNKKYVSWEEVERFVLEVSEHFQNKRLNGVYGLARGGLVLSVMLSHSLDIPLLNAPTSDCLIVDDICDSGESLLHYFKNSSGDKKKKNYICTMYYKPNELGVIPDYYMNEKNDAWIVFPWEIKGE